MWNLKIPPKIKDMVWRSVSNCLPTRAQLRLKYVDISSSCPRCHCAIETISHCLVDCDFAKNCWKMAGLYNGDIGDTSFGDWF